MASSMLEQMRLLHEEIEACERAAADTLTHKPKPYKDALLADLRVSAYLTQAQAASARLYDMYVDGDGSLRAEKRAFGSGEDLSYFYSRMADLREYHRRVTDVHEQGNITAAADEAAEAVLNSFLTDELYGKYIDLSLAFEEWANLPHVRDARASGEAMPDYPHATIDYITYLKKFVDVHTSLPRRVKTSRAFRKYLVGLSNHVVAFFCKTQPLVNVQELLDMMLNDFATNWKAGQSSAWTDAVPPAGDAAAAHSGASAGVAAAGAAEDLTRFTSADDLLEKLGAEGTKNQCQLRGLKAGGTPQERASRLWQVRGLAPDQYPKKFLAGPAAGTTSKAGGPAHAAATNGSAALSGDAVSAAARADPTLARVVALADPIEFAMQHLPKLGIDTAANGGIAVTAWAEEVVCRFISDIFGDLLGNTRRRLEKRQTRNPEEIEKDREMEESEVTLGVTGPALGEGDVDEEEDAPIYNPLNVPLGWDGKPIPLWLFKLHQLHIEYKCEICGGDTYRGRRNFDRHFQEWKHAYHMRMMGIPNTKHFHDITRIEDAKALYAKLSSTLGKEVFRADAEEEFEDSMGNVLNRKTYEDLARQGLL